MLIKSAARHHTGASSKLHGRTHEWIPLDIALSGPASCFPILHPLLCGQGSSKHLFQPLYRLKKPWQVRDVALSLPWGCRYARLEKKKQQVRCFRSRIALPQNCYWHDSPIGFELKLPKQALRITQSWNAHSRSPSDQTWGFFQGPLSNFSSSPIGLYC